MYGLSQATYFHGMLVNRESLPAATISLERTDLFLYISHFTIANWRHSADLKFSNLLKIQ
jgi:hypothetical protein